MKIDEHEFATKAARSISAPFYTLAGVLVGFMIMYIVAIKAGADASSLHKDMLQAIVYVLIIDALWLGTVFSKIRRQHKEITAGPPQVLSSSSSKAPISVEGNGMLVVRAKQPPKLAENRARRQHNAERLGEMAQTDPNPTRPRRNNQNRLQVVSDGVAETVDGKK